MTQLRKLTRAIYKGHAAATRVLGQTFIVYRMTASVNGSIISPEAVAIVKFNAYMQRDSSKKLIETQIFDLVSYAGTLDATKLEVGDILVAFGFGATDDRYCVAQIRYSNPFRTVLMKVETDGQIRFQSQARTTSVEQTEVSEYETGYGGNERSREGHLSLVNGQYTRSAYNGTAPAVIPVGIQIKDRVRDDHDPNLPTQYRKTQMIAYIPPMPGYTPQPLDIIYIDNDREWTIAECRTNTTDLQGTVCIIDTNAP